MRLESWEGSWNDGSMFLEYDATMSGALMTHVPVIPDNSGSVLVGGSPEMMCKVVDHRQEWISCSFSSNLEQTSLTEGDNVYTEIQWALHFLWLRRHDRVPARSISLPGLYLMARSYDSK